MKVIDFLQFLFKFNLSKNQLIKDFELLRNETRLLRDKLVPFNSEEIELLSLKQSNFTKKKGFVRLTKGIFDSIYYENVIAYCIKEYSNKQKLILICSSVDEFLYIVKNDKTHVYLNNVEKGILTNDGKFYNQKNKLLGLIDNDDQLQSHSVWIQGKNVGYINNPRFVSKSIPRAYNLLKPMSKEEQNIFLCLTLINLVEEGQLHKI